METIEIEILQQNRIAKEIKKEASNCCGGAPAISENACCKSDEEKKTEGGDGCGCNTTQKNETKTSCC